MRVLHEELTHRVTREFSAAIGTLSAAAARAQTDQARSELAAVQTSLENFARVHRALQIPEFRTTVDGCVYLEQLCGAISVSRLERCGIELHVLEGTCAIDSEQCWRLGMIVAELVAIAVTPSFAGGSARISVAISRRGAFIGCRIEGNGITRDGEANRSTRIVDALVRELHGAFEQHRSGERCLTTVVFPAA
jgi:two-component sensor histidine kinase